MDDKGHMYDSEKESIPKNAFPILKEEQMLLEGVPEDHRLATLVNLRFKAWLEYNKLKPDMITKMKMKQAFRAGFYAKDLPE